MFRNLTITSRFATCVGVTLALSIVGTAVLAMIIKATIGLRLPADGEEAGLDQVDHGEAGYHFDEAGG